MVKITAASINSIRQETARERIRAFDEQFGEAHLYFAQHAAFPLALTSDLLYRLWANFQRNTRAEKLHIPWIAVADLLLSSLCEEVGHELYEMNIAIRAELLMALKANPVLGKQRLEELSYFLLDYVRQQLHSNNANARRFAQAQRWTALAYTQPEYASYELAEALRTLNQIDRVEQIRIVSLIETLDLLAEPLATLETFTPLLTYARDIERLARGSVEHAKVLLDASQSVVFVEQGLDIQLPTTEKFETYKRSPLETQDMRKDFLVSYHQIDIDWAKWIAWQLEESGYSIVLQEWGFSSEASFVEEVDRIAQSARHLIVVLSPDYLEALALQTEWIEAFWKDPRNKPSFMIAFQIRECRDLLNKILGFIVYTNLVGLDEKSAYEALIARIAGTDNKNIISQISLTYVSSERPPFPVLLQKFLLDAKKSVKIFIPYAREDEKYVKELEMQLAVLMRSGLALLWTDYQIAPSVNWVSEIDSHLNAAQIILLLVSANFLASDYCFSTEMQRAIERHQRGEIRVIPIILHPCIWHEAPFGKLQVLPSDARPISHWVNSDEAFKNIMQTIQQEVTPFVNQSFLISNSKESNQWKEEGDTHFIAHHYEEALAAYNQALALNPGDINVYISRGRTHYNLKDYESALDSYYIAFKHFDRSTFPIEWAEIQLCLGEVYSFRMKGERQKNLERAIAYYQAALQVYTPDGTPTQWAELQIHLGDVSSILAKGDRQKNLEAAIDYYQSALRIYTHDNFPLQWSDLQQKLGDIFVTFSELPDADEQANLDRAVTYFEEISPFEAYIDVSEVAIDNVFQEHLFNKLAQEIATFPLKQRTAVLIDLANRMSFDEQPTPLQQAFLNAGIQLQNYCQPLPTDPPERSKHAALLSIAIKRLRNFAEKQD